MYPQLRAGLVVLAAVALVGTGWFAIRSAAASLAIVRTWHRTDGVLTGLSDRNYIEVELGRDPDTRRVRATADHMVGLSLFHSVKVYADPSQPDRYRLGGIFQLWLWPATLILLASVFALCAVVMMTAGQSPAPAIESEVVIRPPMSEVKAPLFWSLLGLAAFCCGVFIPDMPPFSRLGPLLAGAVFVLGMLLLSVYNFTLRISANSTGMRAASALGWKDVRWDQVKSVERRELRPTYYRAFRGNALPFPGNTTVSVVFADGAGRTLLRMSTRMQPQEAAGRLMDICAARTGLHEQSRKINVPDF